MWKNKLRSYFKWLNVWNKMPASFKTDIYFDLILHVYVIVFLCNFDTYASIYEFGVCIIWNLIKEFGSLFNINDFAYISHFNLSRSQSNFGPHCQQVHWLSPATLVFFASYSRKKNTEKTSIFQTKDRNMLCMYDFFVFVLFCFYCIVFVLFFVMNI